MVSCSFDFRYSDIEENFSFFFLAQLLKPLEDYIARWNGLVKLYRTGKRVGLIEARTLGAKKTTADVIVILDAHCECVRIDLIVKTEDKRKKIRHVSFSFFFFRSRIGFRLY